MTKQIKTAVILAAGKGMRLREMGEMIPKGFLKLGEKSIIEESIERLRHVGIEKIIIVTGHLRIFYDELAEKSNGLIETVYNEHYASSGTMYSLYLARKLVDRDFLLLESDLIYEQRALTATLDFPKDNAVLLSGPTNSGDEIYIEADNGQLIAMSKNRSELGKQIMGELVGINKISQSLYSVMVQYAKSQFNHSFYVDYEVDAFVQATISFPVYCNLIPNLIWSEIDDDSHLNRAKNLIYPQIIENDKGQISPINFQDLEYSSHHLKNET